MYILRKTLTMLGLVAAYAVLFQFCYAWMYTGSPIPDGDIAVFVLSILLNYIPMLVIAIAVWLVATRTIHINGVWKKCSLDLLCTLPIPIIVNWLFLFIHRISRKTKEVADMVVEFFRGL